MLKLLPSSNGRTPITAANRLSQKLEQQQQQQQQTVSPSGAAARSRNRLSAVMRCFPGVASRFRQGRAPAVARNRGQRLESFSSSVCQKADSSSFPPRERLCAARRLH
jgi:hypothetical protein